MESTANTTRASNEKPSPVVLVKPKVDTTTDTATYNADGSLASLSSTYPAGGSVRDGTDISENPPAVSTAKRAPSSTDVWDDVNSLRKVLKANSRGPLAMTAAFMIGACFLVSIIVGSILAMPIIALVSAYDQVRKFFANRKARKVAALNLRVVRSSEGE